jgi:phospholipid-binding lipoprotein MlaA
MSASDASSRQSLLAVVVLALMVTGCASTPRESARSDPLEPINRPIYQFNDAFDRAIFRPVVRGYQKVTPEPVQRGVGNFFANLDDVRVLANSALQAKGAKATRTTLRLAFNTTFGLLGVLDIAGWMGLYKENEDFGQTLGHWGAGPGPYLVIPFLGPSSARDATGLVVDEQLEVLDPLIDDGAPYYSMRALGLIDTRADLLSASRMLGTAAVDPYAFSRQAYLRRRANHVYDGDPPPEILPGRATGGEDDAFDPFSDEDDDLFQDEQDGEGS